MNAKIASLAKKAILELKSKNDELEDTLAVSKKAQKIAFDLFEKGVLEATSIQNKIAEFESQTMQELEIMEKAAQLVSSQDFSFGELSDRFEDNGNLDPLTSFLLTNEL